MISLQQTRRRLPGEEQKKSAPSLVSSEIQALHLGRIDVENRSQFCWAYAIVQIAARDQPSRGMELRFDEDLPLRTPGNVSLDALLNARLASFCKTCQLVPGALRPTSTKMARPSAKPSPRPDPSRPTASDQVAPVSG